MIGSVLVTPLHIQKNEAHTEKPGTADSPKEKVSWFQLQSDCQVTSGKSKNATELITAYYRKMSK